MMNRGVMQRQMFRGGGEAVPNQYKGFSKLPENVQQKMNPALAKKYQQGGIASMMDPASMPQGDPMMGGMPQGGQMDPAQIAMMEAEAAGQAQGEQIGAMVGEQTMMGLDQAEDFQGAIDALRGNSAPLEARYQELAGFVGDQDAMQTPESVLAMVQPTIMMTEQGAVDSGIGQLMQQITGNVEMETPDGQPTAMAEGVGSLMGVGQQPAEKKFLADGGAVIGMSNGGDPSILERFQSVAGDPQARRDALQSDILFSLADRGLAFAGGVDPRTGENMAGAPILSQLGRAGAGLGATIGEKLASNRALDQQTRTAALSEELARERGEIQFGREKELLDQKGKQDIALQTAKFNQTRLLNEDDFGYKTRLATHGAYLTEKLQKLKGSQSQDDINLRGQLERALNETNNNLRRELQTKDFDFKKLAQKTNIEAQKELENLRSGNNQILASLRAQLSLSSQKEMSSIEQTNRKELQTLISELQQDNMKIAAEIDKNAVKVGFENTLLRDKILNVNDIEKMEIGLEQNKQLADHRSAIEKELLDIKNTFTASENVLDRAQKDKLTLSNQEFEERLRTELKQMDVDQRVIDREIEKLNRAFDEKLATRTAEQKDKQLSLTERGVVVDEKYKLGQLAIDEIAAKAVNVGGKAKSAQLTYLTNEERLNSYANGTLDDKTLFEQTVLDYIKPERVWDSENGIYVQGASPQLAPRIQQALQTGNPNFFANQIEKGDGVTVGGTESSEQGTTPVTLLKATAKNSDIMNADGTINLNSTAFEATRPNRFNPEIDYKEVIGLSRLLPGLKKVGSEAFAEALGTMPPENARNYSEAQKTLDAFANDLLQFSTNITGDRVLKFVQELIEKETKNLRPGGILLKTDSDARSSLKALRDGLLAGMQETAALLPEYDGVSTGVKPEQVTKARKNMIEMKILLNEVLAFQKGFGLDLGKPGTSLDETTDQSTGNARNQIMQMRIQNRN